MSVNHAIPSLPLSLSGFLLPAVVLLSSSALLQLSSFLSALPIRIPSPSAPSLSLPSFAKPIFHPRSKTLRHLLESSSIREYSVSAPRQKTVVGELARHTVELYPDGAGALDRLGGPTASVVFRRASSQHYTNTISDPPVSTSARARSNEVTLADRAGSGSPSGAGRSARSVSSNHLFDPGGSELDRLCRMVCFTPMVASRRYRSAAGDKNL